MKIFIFLSILVFLLIQLPVITSAATLTHPALLFNDIKDTPGYQFNTIQPWKGFQDQVIRSADGSLSRKFSSNLISYDRVMYRGNFARDLGLAYQITKKTQYSEKAKEALLNLDIGTVTAKADKAIALGGYSLAYDFIQPTLDPATDSIIRDKLATLV